jgi:hypothetical protein
MDINHPENKPLQRRNDVSVDATALHVFVELVMAAAASEAAVVVVLAVVMVAVVVMSRMYHPPRKS